MPTRYRIVEVRFFCRDQEHAEEIERYCQESADNQHLPFLDTCVTEATETDIEDAKELQVLSEFT